MTAANLPIVATSLSRYGRLALRDNHALPYAGPGHTVVYDMDDREPIDGEAYVTLTDAGRLFVVVARSINGDWFAAAPNRKKVVGPMDEPFLRARIHGRVAAVVYGEARS